MIEMDGTPAQMKVLKPLRNLHEMKAGKCERWMMRAAKAYWNARSNIYPLIMTIFNRAISEDITVPQPDT